MVLRLSDTELIERVELLEGLMKQLRPEQLLAHTVYIKQDRITLHNLSADPGSCVAGDLWFRSDLGNAKLAVDTVVADAKLIIG